MSDFLKNLKSLFIEDGPEKPSKKGTPQKEKDESEDTSTPVPPPEPMMPESSGGGQVSTKFTKVLLKAVERANQEGFDYLEYKNSVRSLSNMSMDEETRFKSAYAMGQTMGADADKLVKSARHYLTVLKDEKKKFDQAAQLQVEKKVASKKRDLQNWEQQIASKEKQIDKLQAEIKTLRSRIGTINEALEKEEIKVQNTQADFVASFNNLYNQISADIEKMTNYLK